MHGCCRSRRSPRQRLLLGAFILWRSSKTHLAICCQHVFKRCRNFAEYLQNRMRTKTKTLSFVTTSYGNKGEQCRQKVSMISCPRCYRQKSILPPHRFVNHMYKSCGHISNFVRSCTIIDSCNLFLVHLRSNSFYRAKGTIVNLLYKRGEMKYWNNGD
jgi:hypothetical protein